LLYIDISYSATAFAFKFCIRFDCRFEKALNLLLFIDLDIEIDGRNYKLPTNDSIIEKKVNKITVTQTIGAFLVSFSILTISLWKFVGLPPQISAVVSGTMTAGIYLMLH